MPNEIFEAAAEVVSAKVTNDSFDSKNTFEPLAFVVLFSIFLVIAGIGYGITTLTDAFKSPATRAAEAAQAERAEVSKKAAERQQIKESEHPVREALKKKARDKAVDFILK